MAPGKPFTLYRRKKVYYARFKKPDGSWTTARATGCTARGAAEAWCIDILATRKPLTNPKLTLAEFAGPDFFSWEGPYSLDRRVSGKRYSPRQCLTKAGFLKNILASLGHLKLTAIKKDTLREFRNRLYQEGWSSSYINQCLSCITAILIHAEEKGLIQFVPRVPPAGNTTTARGILTIEEVKRLFAQPWENPMGKVFNLAAASTGLRRGELLGLLIRDYAGDYLTVTRSWESTLNILNPTTKTGRARHVFLTPMVQTALRALIDSNPWGSPDSFIFYSTAPDKPLDNKVVWKGFTRALRGIGIDEAQRRRRNITFHSWRHFFNSLLINARIPLQKVQSLTGHSTLEMSQHYYHLDDMTDVMHAVEGVFS